MKLQDALQVFGLSGDITPEQVNKQYRALCAKYHPDRNPAGLQMMQAVNAARDALNEAFKKGWNVSAGESNNADYGDELNDAINAAASLDGIEIEVCGSWVWITGNTKDHKETLKAAGYKWARKKVAWYFRPANSISRGRGKFSMDEVREMHGSESVKRKKRAAIAA